ncbi:hypothetical protein NEOLEDRAFT_1150279 [Neolentinus lepideus HHB14362 ss-1]|uniref:Uncharacterized protein n=1 Tax=Neolentinus lepideus HHB14362 ss-1 TaxID=1314782 RepID=A0A165Q6J5_9AGAM|nr:hypothetical protein NEOLEDRAFT_1150279 [Neolentinus lepideus HHB14362 ss-1]
MPTERAAGHINKDFLDGVKVTLMVVRVTIIVDNTRNRIIASATILYTISLHLAWTVQSILALEEEDMVLVVVLVINRSVPSIGIIVLTCLIILDSTKSTLVGCATVLVGLLVPILMVILPMTVRRNDASEGGSTEQDV